MLFGATGDLAKRKLLPGMFHLAQVGSDAGAVPDHRRRPRKAIEVEEFRELARESVEGSGRKTVDAGGVEAIRRLLRFAAVGDGFERARRRRSRGPRGTRRRAGCSSTISSLPPGAAAATVEAIGCARARQWARECITEKPFGTDLASARKLNAQLHSVFDERGIFRIDHYLGREAVQNLLALRFANGMFEPVWNRNHIDHVQIDIPETLSIEMRGSFYEETGAFRDMVVTHLFQVLGFVAMEPPTSLEPKALGLEREKVFDSMSPLRPERRRPRPVRRLPRGGRRRRRLRHRDLRRRSSAFVDNWRWEGVPFYLRSGKRLAESKHLLTIAFKQPPRRMFPLDCDQIAESFGHDHLSFELGDPGSISASFLAKVPGPTIQLGEAHMQLQLRRHLRRHRAGARRLRAPDPRRDARRPHPVHQLRRDRAPLGDLRAGARSNRRRLHVYEPGSWGPDGQRRTDRAAPLAPAQRPRLRPAGERKRAPCEGAPCFRRTCHQRV